MTTAAIGFLYFLVIVLLLQDWILLNKIKVVEKILTNHLNEVSK